jgi:hypothetical protein
MNQTHKIKTRLTLPIITDEVPKNEILDNEIWIYEEQNKTIVKTKTKNGSIHNSLNPITPTLDGNTIEGLNKNQISQETLKDDEGLVM